MRKRSLCVILCAAMLTAFCGCDMSIGSAKSGTAPVSSVSLTGSGAQISGRGVSAKGSEVVISAAGSFSVSGSLDNGRIVVDTGDDPGPVTIILDGADINCADGAAIYVEQAKELSLILADKTQNTVTSAAAGSGAEDAGDTDAAAIFARDDLRISGGGTLTVNSNANNGISCKDDISIDGGTLVVTAANNGIKGSESVTVNGGVITVSAGNDGIKATSADKVGKGYVSINGGLIEIDCLGDGISAETELNINGGTLKITTEGETSGMSRKALKAKAGVNIDGGVFELYSADHAIHSTAGIYLGGGVFDIRAADGKGIAAHGDISITGGSFKINSKSDGIETVGNVYIKSGSLNIVSGSEGIRAGESNTDEGDITVEGGTIAVSAAGDGMDAKGRILVSGGELISLGTSKRLKSFDNDSTQPFIALSVSGGTKEKLTVSNGENELCSIVSEYSFNSLLYSSGALKPATEYTVGTLRDTVNITAQ